MKNLDDYLNELNREQSTTNTDEELLEETKSVFEEEIKVLNQFFQRITKENVEGQIIPLKNKRGCSLKYPPSQEFVLNATLLLNQETHPFFKSDVPDEKEISINARVLTKENGFHNLDFSSIERLLETFSNLKII